MLNVVIGSRRRYSDYEQLEQLGLEGDYVGRISAARFANSKRSQ